MDFIIMMVALFAIMYFLMIRPQQKRARKDQEMRSQLAPGDRVLLTSGVFATITHAGEKQFIVELAPDVQITVLKGSVARKVLPEDEEFEFTDEADEAPASYEEPATYGEPAYDVPDDASSLVEENLTFDPTPEAEKGEEPGAAPEDKN
ncbi:MAG: preprotein translocase subunit YajC [Tessaracoccus sp.]|uniref:preprotein translocase subunit YajC n=1 Tax=Tessaracoccus sp. TaxID=1971211 RepID=UPI001EC426C1|nr:preprotein translocase subunit YajC [Tessaracoccus sp.]MBK7821200.1 preprotein translocase subunit YajC [Tessaracoccus sp.]